MQGPEEKNKGRGKKEGRERKEKKGILGRSGLVYMCTIRYRRLETTLKM